MPACGRWGISELSLTRGDRLIATLKAILLDVDGTLIASNDAHAEAWSRACADFGFVRPTEFFRPLIGMGGDRVLPLVDPALVDDDDPGKAISSRRGEVFRTQYLATLEATPGAKAFVERIRKHGLKTVVATSSSSEDLEPLLDVAGVRELIDVRTTADDASESKPSGAIVAAALRKAKLAPDEAIMLGDTPYDVAAAAEAGVRCIAVRCGGWNDADLVGAIEVYDDPADILEHFATSALGGGA